MHVENIQTVSDRELKRGSTIPLGGNYVFWWLDKAFRVSLWLVEYPPLTPAKNREAQIFKIFIFLTIRKERDNGHTDFAPAVQGKMQARSPSRCGPVAGVCGCGRPVAKEVGWYISLWMRSAATYHAITIKEYRRHDKQICQWLISLMFKTYPKSTNWSKTLYTHNIKTLPILVIS